jgi:hypothetical protein
LSSNAVAGQSQPVGTVTLTAPAPTGGAVVRLESSNGIAKVPASVTVPAGQTTATFVVDTGTVDARIDLTISATYLDVTRTVQLSVLLPRPRASFTVTSPAFGQDVCVLIEKGLELDCRLDGKGSDGRLVRWSWLLEARDKIRTERSDPVFAEIDTTCRFVEGASTGTDSNGIYVDMKIQLEVTDKEGDQNTAERLVKLYTNNNCGF